MALIQSQPSQSSSPLFALCDECRWCATYFDTDRLPNENRCPHCNTTSHELSILSIMPNESFTFNHNDKRGVELKFMGKHK